MSSTHGATRGAVETPIGRSPWQMLVTLVAIAFALTVAAGMAWRGWTFYQLGLDARVDHPAFRVLSPAGRVGIAYGEIGACLVFLNLLYLVRRRLARWPLGPMKMWLDAHVLTGIVAGTFVVFHSAFQLRTPISTLTAVSLGFVIVTGIIGRFLYAFAPKVDTVAFAQTLRAIEAAVPGLGAWIGKQVQAIPPTRLGPEATLLRAVLTLPRWRMEASARREAVRMSVLGWADLQRCTEDDKKHVKRLSARATVLAWREVRAAAASSLLESWRSLHRFAALLMVLSVVVHIVVALYYGYGFGGE